MRRALTFALNLQPSPEGQDILGIDVGSGVLVDFCVELCLLEKALVDSIQIVDKKGRLNLGIYIDKDLPIESRAKVISRSTNAIKLAVTQTEVEFWVELFLKYYRDGMSDVDHVDVDIGGGEAGEDVKLFLVLKNLKAAGAVSAEEAARRLGM